MRITVFLLCKNTQLFCKGTTRHPCRALKDVPRATCNECISAKFPAQLATSTKCEVSRAGFFRVSYIKKNALSVFQLSTLASRYFSRAFYPPPIHRNRFFIHRPNRLYCTSVICVNTNTARFFDGSSLSAVFHTCRLKINIFMI